MKPYVCYYSEISATLNTLSRSARRVFDSLLVRSSSKDGKTWPSYKTLREDCGGVSEETIRRGVRELEKNGLLEVTVRYGTSNIYDLSASRPTKRNGGYAGQDEDHLPAPEPKEYPSDSVDEPLENCGVTPLENCGPNKKKEQEERTTPLPPSGQSDERPAVVEDREGGDSSPEIQGGAGVASLPSPQGDKPGALPRPVAEERAADLVPAVQDFRSLERIVAETRDVNAEGQEVTDWRIYRLVNGRTDCGIPAEALECAVAELIAPSAARTCPPGVVAGFSRLVAAMGRWQEITPRMLSRAAERIASGRKMIDVAVELWREVMVHRWVWRKGQHGLLLRTDNGRHLGQIPSEDRLGALAGLLEGREAPLGEMAVPEEDRARVAA